MKFDKKIPPFGGLLAFFLYSTVENPAFSKTNCQDAQQHDKMKLGTYHKRASAREATAMITAIAIILGATLVISVLSALGVVAFNVAKISGNVITDCIVHFFDYVIAKCDDYMEKHYTQK